jgi:oligoribonuclease (3'-5' exoribonuclease)
MPKLNAILDRSILDCSTLKELIRRFNFSIYHNAPIKGGNLHRALDDIRNSIEEFRYYKTTAFTEKPQPIKQENFSLQKDITQYLVWISIHSSEIHCILTDGHLNIVDEIENGKTNSELMEFFHRNQVRQARLVVVAGKFLGPIRAELNKLAPEFNEFCHYRSIDIDVVSILCEKFFPDTYQQRPMTTDRDDLKNSIELLRFYRATIFK